jgi:hypothetical protein
MTFTCLGIAVIAAVLGGAAMFWWLSSMKIGPK